MTEPSQRALDLAALALHIPEQRHPLPGDAARLRRVAVAMQRVLDAIAASTIDVQPEPADLRGLAEADHAR